MDKIRPFFARQLMTAALLAGMLTAGVYAQAPASRPTVAPVDAALASRLETLALRYLRGQKVQPAHVKFAAALLESAARLDPSEPRYLRLLIEANLDSKEESGLETALNAAKLYRKLEGDDQAMQVLMINLYLARMQAADKRAAYLGDIVGNTSIDSEVRSVAAVMASDLLAERSQEDALRMARQASVLNPYNYQALQRRFELSARTSTALERVTLYGAMLRSNPGQFAPAAGIAGELAEAGYPEDSLQWFNMAATIAGSWGSPASRELLFRYAVQLFIADQLGSAIPLADNLIKAKSDEYPMIVVRMMMERRSVELGAKPKGVAVKPQDLETFNRLRSLARNTLVNQFARIRSVLGDKTATTQPAVGQDIAVPDLSGDPAMLTRAADNVREAYLQTLGELAWFELYYNERPDVGKTLTKFLSSLVADSNPLAVRLNGWCLIADGKTDEAREKLSSIADKDPLAAMGLVHLWGPGEQARADAEAAKVLNSAPYGYIGAVLRYDFRGRDVNIAAKPGTAPIKAEVANLPKDLFSILQDPGKSYLLRAEPLKVAYAYGEPMLLRVSIQNVSQLDLTIGREGIIHPDLWFDASIQQLQGDVPQPMVGVCVDHIVHQRVLHPKEVVSQIVRVDNGVLAAALGRFPWPPISVPLTVRTNPTVADNGAVLCGPGGQMVAASRIMERTGIKRDPDTIGKLITSLPSSSADEKIRKIDLLAGCCRSLRQGDVSPDSKNFADSLQQAVHKAADDAAPAVRSYARFVEVGLLPDEPQAAVVTKMLAEQDWAARLFGVAAAGSLPAEKAKALLAPLAQNDADPLIKRVAGAAVEVADLPPPSTQPATAPIGPTTNPIMP